MTPRFDLGAPVDTATDRSPPGPIGTWTIDHAHSSVALTWRRLRLGSVTGRLHCLGSSTSTTSRPSASSASSSRPACRS